jgi:hypothetical protein
MAEPTRSRRLLRRSDMSKFGVEAEVVCACSQRRPQDLVATLTTTGQRQVPLSGSNSDDTFMCSVILGDVAGNSAVVSRSCAQPPAPPPADRRTRPRRLGSNGSACRVPSSPSRGSLPITAQQVQRAVVGVPKQPGAEWRVLLHLVQGDEGREGILHHILGLDHVRDFI